MYCVCFSLWFCTFIDDIGQRERSVRIWFSFDHKSKKVVERVDDFTQREP